MQEGFAQHGEVFTVPVAHKRITFLIGPDVSGHFFKAGDDEMSQSEVSIKCILMLSSAYAIVLSDGLALDVLTVSATSMTCPLRTA